MSLEVNNPSNNCLPCQEGLYGLLNPNVLGTGSIGDGNLFLADDQTWKSIIGLHVFNVQEYGAVTGGIVDNTTAFQAACTAAGAVKGVVFIPRGLYLLNGDVTVPLGVLVIGESMIGSIVQRTIVDGGVATFNLAYGARIENFQIWAIQPDTADILEILHYKPAAKFASLARAKDIITWGNWNAFDVQAGVVSIAGCLIEAYNIGVTVDNSADTVWIRDCLFSSLNQTANQATIYRETNATSVSVLVGRGDDLKLSGLLFLNRGPGVSTELGAWAPNITAENIWFDNAGGIVMTKGRMTMTGGSMDASGVRKTYVTGTGQLEITGTKMFCPGDGGSAAALFEIDSGLLMVNGGSFVMEAALNQRLVRQSGGTLVFNNANIDHGAITGTLTNPVIDKTGGSCSITGNKVSPITGTATFIAVTGSQVNDNVQGNVTPGWRNSGLVLTVVFENGWANREVGGYLPAGYYKRGDKVFLQGSITGGTATDGTVMFTLPVGYRPTSTVVFAIISNGIGAPILINDLGQVLLYGGSTVSVSLDGISFLTGVNL